MRWRYIMPGAGRSCEAAGAAHACQQGQGQPSIVLMIAYDAYIYMHMVGTPLLCRAK